MSKIYYGFILLCFLNACAILEPVKYNIYKDLSQYKYVIISQTSSLSSGFGGGFSNYATTGYAYSLYVNKSINPSDIIAGVFMNKGFVIVDEVKNNKTLVIKYGQGNKRNVASGWGGYTLGVSIQALDAQTQELVFMCQAEGQGSTEADDLREAITRCLSKI